MPKGIRKACANCIKARLACDEGRPCQRCVVHQCDCVAVPRKPRVKKQKLDLEPPMDTKPTLIPTIDSCVDTVTSNWGPNEFIQGAYSSFQLEKLTPPQNEESSFFEGFNSPNSGIVMSPPTRLSPRDESPPSNVNLPSPTLSVSSPLSSSAQITSSTSPFSWQQLNSSLLQQYINSPLSMLNLQAIQQVVQQAQQQQQQPPQQSPPQTQPIQQAQQTPPPQVQQLTQQNNEQNQTLQAIQQQTLQTLIQPGYDASQMMSLLLDEKPFNDWQDLQLGNYIDGQQVMDFNALSPPLKKRNSVHHMPSFPQPKNATPLFPSPIAIFDKQKFQLLDANEAMAKFVGHNSVLELSANITTVDDLIDSEAAHVAKNALTNFVTNPSPVFRMCDIKTRGGQPKTVEFHVDLTEQLMIFSVKSVFDTVNLTLPETMSTTAKKDISMCNCKACEFLVPID